MSKKQKIDENLSNIGGTVALLFIAILLLLGIFGPIMYGAYCCH